MSEPNSVAEPSAPDGALVFFDRPDAADLDPRRRLTWQVGDVAREIIERLVDTRATDDDLATVADQLKVVAERLGQFEHGRRYDGYGEAAATGGPPLGHADFSPLIGRANPLAPPMQFDLLDGISLTGEVDIETLQVGATVTFGSAYEGPPGFVHGGILSAAFDEILGATQALTGNPGMTGTLSVRYLAPTPLHVELRFEAVVQKIEGRKISVTASVFAGDVECATAEGLFISVDFDKLRLMQAERNQT